MKRTLTPTGIHFKAHTSASVQSTTWHWPAADQTWILPGVVVREPMAGSLAQVDTATCWLPGAQSRPHTGSPAFSIAPDEAPLAAAVVSLVSIFEAGG